jgi:hypothetical protein
MRYDDQPHIGMRVRVRHCAFAYQLPEGLPEGAEVTLVGFDIGYWTVRYRDKLFQVAMPCVGVGGILPTPISFRGNRS